MRKRIGSTRIIEGTQVPKYLPRDVNVFVLGGFVDVVSEIGDLFADHAGRRPILTDAKGTAVVLCTICTGRQGGRKEEGSGQQALRENGGSDHHRRRGGGSSPLVCFARGRKLWESSGCGLSTPVRTEKIASTMPYTTFAVPSASKNTIDDAIHVAPNLASPCLVASRRDPDDLRDFFPCQSALPRLRGVLSQTAAERRVPRFPCPHIHSIFIPRSLSCKSNAPAMLFGATRHLLLPAWRRPCHRHQ